MGQAMRRAVGLGCVLGMLAATGCATTRGMDAPASPAQLAAPSQGAEQTVSQGPCRVTGPSRVVAFHAYVPGGVEARLEEGRASVLFAHHKSTCEAATVDLVSGTVLVEEACSHCPGDDASPLAANDADEDRSASPFLGFRRPASHPVGLGLYTWVDENPEGHALRAKAMTGLGGAVGPALAMSPSDVSVIGQTSTVVGADGRGLVAYFASGDDGVDVRVTPFACEAP